MDKTMNIWGRDFELEVFFETDEPGQRENDILNHFLSCTDEHLKDPKVVQDFCKQRDGDEIDDISNVFRFVIPIFILVQDNDTIESVVLGCAYKVDLEAGVVLYFENGKFVRVGTQEDFE